MISALSEFVSRMIHEDSCRAMGISIKAPKDEVGWVCMLSGCSNTSNEDRNIYAKKLIDKYGKFE